MPETKNFPNVLFVSKQYNGLVKLQKDGDAAKLLASKTLQIQHQYFKFFFSSKVCKVFVGV